MFNEKFKTTMGVLAFAACLLFGGETQAIMLGFSPSNPVAHVGDSVDVDLVISGLGDFAPPSLSVFDLDVLFDPTILGLTNVAFGDPVFGDQLDLFGFGHFSDVDAVAPGAANLFEISFDLPSDLDLLQPGSFTLATTDLRCPWALAPVHWIWRT